MHCTNKQITELNWYLNLTNGNKNYDWHSNQSGKAWHVMRRRVLRRPIVLFRVRCSILILLIRTLRCSIPHLWLIVRLCWKYMLRKLRTYLRLEQHVGQNDNTKLANESFGNVTECKYLGRAVIIIIIIIIIKSIIPSRNIGCLWVFSTSISCQEP